MSLLPAIAIQLSLCYEESLYLRTQFVHHSREGWKIGYQRAKRILSSSFYIVHYTLVKEILGAFEINVPQLALVMEAGLEIDIHRDVGVNVQGLQARRSATQ